MIDWATSGDRRERRGFLGSGRIGLPLMSGDVVVEESPAVEEGDLEDAKDTPISIPSHPQSIP